MIFVQCKGDKERRYDSDLEATTCLAGDYQGKSVLSRSCLHGVAEVCRNGAVCTDGQEVLLRPRSCVSYR